MSPTTTCTDSYTVAVAVNRRMTRARMFARAPSLELFLIWRLQSTLQLSSSWVGPMQSSPFDCDINIGILQARSTQHLKLSICRMLSATMASLWSWAHSC